MAKRERRKAVLIEPVEEEGIVDPVEEEGNFVIYRGKYGNWYKSVTMAEKIVRLIKEEDGKEAKYEFDESIERYVVSYRK